MQIRGPAQFGSHLLLQSHASRVNISQADQPFLSKARKFNLVRAEACRSPDMGKQLIHCPHSESCV
ncbi:hypothetical protein L484_003476 [Morus notabilis]|uniref:Uncharacterized protein n=1 Tax=Morus notabilis TaxID=981085 RepID=W9QJK9_9ROSA|nr:hypothetical protein L484_003476 [Morus notabilis]